MKAIVKGLNLCVLWGYKFFRNLGAACLACIFLTITVGIFTRYVMHSPITWGEELCCFMMVHICFISAAVTTVKKKHIVADFFVAHMPASLKRFVRYFGCVLQVVFLCVLFYSVIELLPSLVWKSPILRIPRQMYYVSALICSVFMVITVVADILTDFFPDCDIVGEMAARDAQADKKAEQEDAEELQRNMDRFMEQAGYGPGEKGEDK